MLIGDCITVLCEYYVVLRCTVTYPSGLFFSCVCFDITGALPIYMMGLRAYFCCLCNDILITDERSSSNGISNIIGTLTLKWCMALKQTNNKIKVLLLVMFTLNEKEQCLQCQGRRLVWVRMCFFSILGFLHRIPHSSHTYLQPGHSPLEG